MSQATKLNKSILDTDTYSEILKGKNSQVASNAKSYLFHHESFTLCVLTIFEIVWGLQRMERTSRIKELEQELLNVDVISIDVEIATLSGRIFGELYRNGNQIGSIDALIAATALQYDLTLVTGNTRHFERVQAFGYPLKLTNWKLSQQEMT